jgi:hypothetical protein
VRGGEKDDSPDVFRDALDGGGNGRSRRYPYHEYGIGMLERLVENGGVREVAAHDFDSGGQSGGIRVAGEGADVDVCMEQV